MVDCFTNDKITKIRSKKKKTDEGIRKKTGKRYLWQNEKKKKNFGKTKIMIATKSDFFSLFGF